jgi:hypothetical protein
MRITTLALAAFCCAAALPARAQTAPPPPPDTQDQDQNEEGGSGYLPGAQFQRKLDGGPGFVCTATNALHDQQCTASCRRGETADCVDAEGGGTPTCNCTKG